MDFEVYNEEFVCKMGRRMIAVSTGTQDLEEYGDIARSALHSCVCTDAAFLPTYTLTNFYEENKELLESKEPKMGKI